MPAFKDITGQKFTRLMVISKVSILQKSSNKLIVHWLCICDCGNYVTVNSANLRRGFTKSCGCLKMEVNKQAPIKHGKRHTKEYNIWAGIKQRCRNQNSLAYKYYGARGINICDRWFDSFENFYTDMGDCPSKLHSIERVDNNLGYYKENCVWATCEEQANNKRNTRILEYNGKKYGILKWARETGLS